MASGSEVGIAMGSGRHLQRMAMPIAMASSRLLGRTHTAMANATPASTAYRERSTPRRAKKIAAVHQRVAGTSLLGFKAMKRKSGATATNRTGGLATPPPTPPPPPTPHPPPHPP